MGEMRRHGERLRALEGRVFVARMGGAVGSFAAMQGKGRAVQAGVAKRLGLADGEIPARATLDHFAEYVSALALMCATLEKIARNLIDLQRTEIAEVAEAFHHGKIGSSTMPQKRNPTRLMNVVGLSKLMRLNAPGALDAMVQTDEGDGAAYNIADLALRQGAVMAISALANLAQAMAELTVDEQAMRDNLARSRGLIMTEAVMMHLAPALGRHHAHDLMYEIAMTAFEKGEPLVDAFRRHPEIVARQGQFDADRLFDPANYLGEAPDCVDDEGRRVRAFIAKDGEGRA
jgi:adenylosuccinate lyase